MPISHSKRVEWEIKCRLRKSRFMTVHDCSIIWLATTKLSSAFLWDYIFTITSWMFDYREKCRSYFIVNVILKVKVVTVIHVRARECVTLIDHMGCFLLINISSGTTAQYRFQLGNSVRYSMINVIIECSFVEGALFLYMRRQKYKYKGVIAIFFLFPSREMQIYL